METLVAYGSEIKTLEDKGDRLKIGGYLVLFGSPEEPDATRLRDYFTPSTDFDIPTSGASSTVYYHHGLNPTLKARPLGKAYLTIDEAGVWMEAELRARDEYEAKIQELVRQGKLGLSSGTASHLVERTAVKNVYGEEVHRIDRWPLGLDASLTPAPGEPRTRAWCLKSLDEVAVEWRDELSESGRLSPALERAVLAEYVRVQAGLSGVRFELPVEALKSVPWDESQHPRGKSGPGTNAGSFTAAGTSGGRYEVVAESLPLDGIRNLWNRFWSDEASMQQAELRRNDRFAPQGERLSDNLSFQINGITSAKHQLELRERARRAFSVVDAVVGLGDGRAYSQRLPVEFIQMKALGHVISDGNILVPKIMYLHAAGIETEFTVAHEAWHVLETVLRHHLRNSSDDFEDLTTDLMEAIERTHTYNGLKELREKNEIMFVSPSGTVKKRPINQRIVEYQLQPKELLARAFGQYVTVKSGDPVMQRQLEDYIESWGLSQYEQWPKHEFVPIVYEFDELFQRLGMIG